MQKFCQSCGMPMKHDPVGGGTNADGSRSEKYCGYCYESGKFRFEGRVEEFQENCRKMMVDRGRSKFVAGLFIWLFSRRLRRLERWKSAT